MRDVKKAIEEYNTMVAKYAPKYGFRMAELDEIRNITNEEDPGSIYALIANAVSFGFVVGYRAGRRDAKTRATRGM